MTKSNTIRPQIRVRNINDWQPYKGHVLIKAVSKENFTTKSGVIIGFLPEKQFGEGKESHVADFTETEGEVVALPLIHYTEGYVVPNEIQVGDRVWFSYRGSVGATEVISEGIKYMLVDYSYLIASRGDVGIKILNGYVLVEDVYFPDNPTVVQVERKKDITKGIVRYFGTPRDYADPRHSDDISLSEGDLVLIRKNCPYVNAERQKFLASLDDGKMYRRLRRKDIVAVLNSFETVS